MSTSLSLSCDGIIAHGFLIVNYRICGEHSNYFGQIEKPSSVTCGDTFPLVRKGEGLSLIICEKRYIKSTFESIKGRFDLVNIAKQESLLLCEVFLYQFENMGREEENADKVGDEH